MNPSVLDVWEKFSADKQWHDLVVQALDGEAGKLEINMDNNTDIGCANR